MANDVKLRSSDYPTKPTPPVSPPPHRNYQHNNNQMIPTTTTKDQATNVPPDIPTGHSDTSNQDYFDLPPGISDNSDHNFNKMTQDAARPKNKWMLLAAAMDTVIFASIKDTPGFITSNQDDSETSNQDDFNRMTIEEQIQ